MNRIKELRVEKNLKQSDLAQILNVKQNTISNWENGRTEIDWESTLKLADHFNVSVDYILGRTDSSESELSSITLPEKYKDIAAAFNKGAENLTPEDIQDVIKYIELLKLKRNM